MPELPNGDRLMISESFFSWVIDGLMGNFYQVLLRNGTANLRSNRSNEHYVFEVAACTEAFVLAVLFSTEWQKNSDEGVPGIEICVTRTMNSMKTHMRDIEAVINQPSAIKKLYEVTQHMLERVSSVVPRRFTQYLYRCQARMKMPETVNTQLGGGQQGAGMSAAGDESVPVASSSLSCQSKATRMAVVTSSSTETLSSSRLAATRSDSAPCQKLRETSDEPPNITKHPILLARLVGENYHQSSTVYPMINLAPNQPKCPRYSGRNTSATRPKTTPLPTDTARVGQPATMGSPTHPDVTNRARPTGQVNHSIGTPARHDVRGSGSKFPTPEVGASTITRFVQNFNPSGVSTDQTRAVMQTGVIPNIPPNSPFWHVHTPNVAVTAANTPFGQTLSPNFVPTVASNHQVQGYLPPPTSETWDPPLTQSHTQRSVSDHVPTGFSAGMPQTLAFPTTSGPSALSPVSNSSIPPRIPNNHTVPSPALSRFHPILSQPHASHEVSYQPQSGLPTKRKQATSTRSRAPSLAEITAPVPPQKRRCVAALAPSGSIQYQDHHSVTNDVGIYSPTREDYEIEFTSPSTPNSNICQENSLDGQTIIEIIPDEYRNREDVTQELVSPQRKISQSSEDPQLPILGPSVTCPQQSFHEAVTASLGRTNSVSDLDGESSVIASVQTSNTGESQDETNQPPGHCPSTNLSIDPCRPHQDDNKSPRVNTSPGAYYTEGIGYPHPNASQGTHPLERPESMQPNNPPGTSHLEIHYHQSSNPDTNSRSSHLVMHQSPRLNTPSETQPRQSHVPASVNTSTGTHHLSSQRDTSPGVHHLHTRQPMDPHNSPETDCPNGHHSSQPNTSPRIQNQQPPITNTTPGTHQRDCQLPADSSNAPDNNQQEGHHTSCPGIPSVTNETDSHSNIAESNRAPKKSLDSYDPELLLEEYKRRLGLKECVACGMIFDRVQYLLHMGTHDPDLTCRECGVKPDDAIHLQSHFIESHYEPNN